MSKHTLSLCITLGLLGCGNAGDEPVHAQATSPLSGTHHTLTSGGMPREYQLYLPPSIAAGKRPLVLILHGWGGGLGTAESFGMVQKGTEEGFIVAALQGTPCDANGSDGNCTDDDLDGKGDQRGWNTSITPSTGIAVDDVHYVGDVIADIQTHVAVNEKRIYAAGLSQGGMMTYRLATELSDTLAAVGIVSGTIGLDFQCDPLCSSSSCTYACDYGNSCKTYMMKKPKGPISVAIIHGTMDDHLWYDGALGTCTPGLDAVPLKEAIDFWATGNDCTNPPHHLSNSAFDRTRFFWCDQHTEVVTWLVKGMKHEWQQTVPGNSFSTNEALWTVFKRRHL